MASPRTLSAFAVASMALLVAVSTAGCINLPFFSQPGSRARDLVSAEKFTTLVVEVDWMTEGSHDYQPSALVLTFLQQRLSERLNKPGGVTVELGNAIASTRQSYGAGDLANVERDNRGSHDAGSTVTMWVVFATHSSDDTPNGRVIGLAYAGSAFAIFAASIEEVTGLLVSAAEVERIAVVHEAGHLLGLVNNGTPMVTPHEDTGHPRHSTNPASVMYWEVEGGGVVNLIKGGNAPDNFDANDIADLRGIGGI